MTELSVQNMTCSHCVSAVTDAVKSIDPAAKVSVDLQTGRVRVDGDAAADRLIHAIEDAGYPAAAVGNDAATALRTAGCCGGCS